MSYVECTIAWLMFGDGARCLAGHGRVYWQPKQGEWAVKLEDVNPQIRARWQEVMDAEIVIEKAEPCDIDEGFVNLFLVQGDADKWGIYTVLSISPDGTVAEYNVNQPYHFATFAELLTAASVRTAAS